MSIPKSKLKRIWFSRRYLDKILKTKGILKCHYCTNKNLKIQWDNYYIPPNQKATIDHILPISKGGGVYDKMNIVVSCEECNRKKSDKNYLEFKNK